MTHRSLQSKFGLFVLFLTWLAYFVAIGFVFFDEQAGQGKRIATIAAGGAIVALISYFWLFLNSQNLTTRVVVFGLPAIVAILLATLQVDGFSGGLIPNFRFRWQEPHDTTLKSIEPEVLANGIELLETGEFDFPQFLGPNRDGTVLNVKLAIWKDNPPREKWRIAVGAGWSSFVAVNGYAVTMEQRGDDELVTCYEIETGELKWAHAIQTRHETILGGVGPRSTPTIHEGAVFSLGATGMLHCLNGSTGDVIWKHDLVAHMGGTIENDEDGIAFGRSGSPLIVDRSTHMSNQIVFPNHVASSNRSRHFQIWLFSVVVLQTKWLDSCR